MIRRYLTVLIAFLASGLAIAATIVPTDAEPPPPPCSTPGFPQNLLAKPAKKAVTLTWAAGSLAPSGGYRIHHTQAGKLQLRGGVGPTVLTYKDGGLTSRQAYTYVGTAWNDCSVPGNGTFDMGVDTESSVSNQASATAQ